MNSVPYVEDLFSLNIPLCHTDIVKRIIIVELASRNLQKYESTVRLLKYNNHICYVSILNAVFQSFRCPNCCSFVHWSTQFGEPNNYMQLTSESPSQERKSNSRNSL